MKKYNQIFTLLIAVIFAGVVTSASAQNQESKSSTILEAVSKKYGDIKSYKATFSFASEGGKNLKGEATVKGDKFRLKMAGQEVFSDAKTMATYVKENNEVNLQDYDHAELGDLNPVQIFTAYKKGYVHEFIRQGREGGQTYNLVQLTPEGGYSKFSKVTLWINAGDNSIKKWRILLSDGQQLTYTIESFQPNVTVADSYFNFDRKKYPGVEVVDLR